MTGKFAKIFLMIISLPLFLLLAEIILTIIPIDTFFENRFFLVNRALDYPELFKKDKELFWRFRPSQSVSSKFFKNKEYHINDYGLRGDEIKPDTGQIRIIGLGNSCTFGWGIGYDTTYLQQLSRLLATNAEMPSCEIINAGIPGYSSFQGRRFFFSDLADLNPDIVLMMFGWNDQWAAADNIPDDMQKMPPQIIIDIQNSLSRLKLYRLIKKIILSVIEEPLDNKLNRENPVYRVNETEFFENLETIAVHCLKNNIVPIVLTSPIPSLDKYYPPGSKSMMHNYHEYYNHQARNLTRNSPIQLIDLARIFDNYDNLFDDARTDPIHFNVLGHKVAGEAIYDYLKENREEIFNQ
ncbi:MAG: SGNH/GDSL hydrolase family protein [Candidatus Zixiibacteriota bacterium]